MMDFKGRKIGREKPFDVPRLIAVARSGFESKERRSGKENVLIGWFQYQALARPTNCPGRH